MLVRGGLSILAFGLRGLAMILSGLVSTTPGRVVVQLGMPSTISA
jgi:hypothetical protein